MTDTTASTSRWTGRLHDGLTALGQSVEVALAADALEIRRADGTVLARWPYASLIAIEPLRRDQPAVLARGDADDARLTLTRPAAYDALLARAPQLAGGGIAALGRGARKALLWGVAMAAVAAALWFGWPKLADGLATWVPTGIETRMGEQAREQITNRTKPCDLAEGRAALDTLMARLTGAMGYTAPVTVTVVDLPIVNAVALPGGQILLFRQLITEAQSPEELAAVLAHELGHLAAHHPTRNLVRQFGLGLIITALSGSSSWDGVAQFLLSNAYTRELELEADGHALETLEKAKIGGQGWVDFFDRHAGGSAGGRLDSALAYLSNHPASAERRDRAKNLPPSTTPAMSAGDWLVLRSICQPRSIGPRPR